MKSRKKHKSSLSVLVVPDDKDEPRSFRLSMLRVKVLFIIGIFLSIHIILGVIAYWRYAVVKKHNVELTNENQALQENNAQISQLFKKLDKAEEDINKFKTMLGIGEDTFASGQQIMGTIHDYLTDGQEIRPAVGGPENEISNSELQKMLQYLARAGSDLHNYTRSIPTYLPVKGYTSKEYMEFSEKEEHPGIDIAADIGTPIYAAADGVVLVSDWEPELGNRILISHGNGFFTIYGHNKINNVRFREFVEKGQIIALLGSSGASSGPHLHFEIWKNFKPINPRNYLIGLE